MKSLFLFFGLLVSSLAHAQEGYEYKIPQKLSDGWAVKRLEESGINPFMIINSINNLNAKEGHKVHSYLIVKNDKLVFEEYFGKHDQSQKHDLRSVTKSIIALLTGIAIEQGLFELDDPVQKHLAELANAKNPDPRKAKITVRHLLSMSSGLDCNDYDRKSKGQEDRIYNKKDWIQSLADLPMINEPGEVSYYCTGGVMMLATILERTSGLSLEEYAQKHLFAPLGITAVDWGHTKKKEVISAGKRLYMLPRDMAKLGLLMLKEGQWKGQQIVPQNWIAELHQTKTKIGNLDYSFWWWQIPFPNNGKPIKPTVATGNGGQYIMCFPKHGMVVIFTGGAFNSPEQQMPFGITNNFILPALR